MGGFGENSIFNGSPSAIVLINHTSAAWTHGNPDNIVFPTDTFGRMCGKDPGLENKPVLFFFDLTECAKPSVLVTGCPTKQVGND